MRCNKPYSLILLVLLLSEKKIACSFSVSVEFWWTEVLQCDESIRYVFFTLLLKHTANTVRLMMLIFPVMSYECIITWYEHLTDDIPALRALAVQYVRNAPLLFDIPCFLSPLLLMQMYSYFCKVISMSAGHCFCDFSRLNVPVRCSHLNSLWLSDCSPASAPVSGQAEIWLRSVRFS